jgi:tetratricopeptide (TPR) repeat protein
LFASALAMPGSSAQAAPLNPQDVERRCNDYTIAPAQQISSCTSILGLYGTATANQGLAGVAHLARGTAYARIGDMARAQGDYREAIRIAGLAIAGDKSPLFYNDRCWARAVAMMELDTALADCNEALRLMPGFAAALDSRAFLHLRQGQFREAIADYDAALKAIPKDPYSLYGRGIAKARAGDSAGSNADIAAGTSLQNGIAEEFAAYGVKQ